MVDDSLRPLPISNTKKNKKIIQVAQIQRLYRIPSVSKNSFQACQLQSMPWMQFSHPRLLISNNIDTLEKRIERPTAFSTLSFWGEYGKCSHFPKTVPSMVIRYISHNFAHYPIGTSNEATVAQSEQGFAGKQSTPTPPQVFAYLNLII